MNFKYQFNGDYYNVSIVPSILSIRTDNKSALDICLSDCVEITYSVEIVINDVSWKIPYLVLLTKSFERSYDNSGELIDKYGNKGSIQAYKKRAINIRLYEIESKKYYEAFIHLLFRLDCRYNRNEISIDELNFINSSTFFLHTDPYFIKNEPQYKILVYNDTRFKTHSTLRGTVEEEKLIPYINDKHSLFSDQKKIAVKLCGPSGWLYDTEIIATIVPDYFGFRYAANFDALRDYGEYGALKQFYHFIGSLDECRRIITLDDEIKKIQEKINRESLDKKYRIQDNNSVNWEKEYFDTMTDGQLGDYDDFTGDIDEIDTWARG